MAILYEFSADFPCIFSPTEGSKRFGRCCSRQAMSSVEASNKQTVKDCDDSLVS